MKFFIDSGHLPDMEPLVALGIIDGVTTNPSLLAKEKAFTRLRDESSKIITAIDQAD